MNSTTTKVVIAAALAAGALWSSGCTTVAPTPRVTYPVTYEIPVGNTRVRADAGTQNLEVNAVQAVTVVPERRLYYRVDSPVEVLVTVQQETSRGELVRVDDMRGTNFTNSILPGTSRLRFLFQVVATNSSGTARFTLSDQPIAPAVVGP